MGDTIPLITDWLSVGRSMDDINGFKTIYRVKNAAWITVSPGAYTDQYVWAGTRDKGKALALPLGWDGAFGVTGIMTQADSAVPRLYWQGLRWLAGDYQGGCINPAMTNFNPEARVDDGSCPALGIAPDRRPARNVLKISGRRVRFSQPLPGGSRLRILDLRGHAVWASTVPESTGEFDLPGGLLTGLYILEATGANMSFQGRILIQ
jgi:hypothetical protein